jgi:peroxiredoxin
MDPHGLLADWLRTTFPGGPPSLAERTVPPFLLPDADGSLVSSEDMKAQGPYVLTFFHGSWCQACIDRLKVFGTALNLIHELGADLVACSPETLAYPRKLKSEHGLRFRILSDVDCTLGLDLGIAFSAPDALRGGLAKAGVDLVARHGDGRWILPIPVTLVVDRSGTVVKAFSEMEPRRDVNDILNVLAGLT